MELKEFIKTALTDITDAVSELQEELTNGAIVSPSLPNAIDKTVEIDNRNVILTQVAFDVAITAGGTDTIKGGAKGGLHVFSAKVDGSNEEHTENVSHGAFTIPVVLPQQHNVRSAQEKGNDWEKGAVKELRGLSAEIAQKKANQANI